ERRHYAVIVRRQIELPRLVHLVQFADYLLDRTDIYFTERGGRFGLRGLAVFGFLLLLGFFRLSGLFGFSGRFLFFLLSLVSLKPGLLFALLSLFGPLADFLERHLVRTYRWFQHSGRVVQLF